MRLDEGMIEQINTENQIVPVSASTRFVSALIDYIPMLMITMIANTVGMVLFFESFPSESLYAGQYMSEEESMNMITTMFGSMSSMILPMSIGLAVAYIYFLCKDLIGGRSPGKRLQKLQLVRLDGTSVSYTRMIVRNLFLIIWPVELIMYLANKGQRLGDLVCKTTVVTATEDNKQPVDKQKVIISVLIVTVFCSFVAVLYNWGMTSFFDWYMRFIEGVMQNTIDYNY